jgi:hypothetical protein
MRPISARVLRFSVFMIASTTLSLACLVPPDDGVVPSSSNHAPRIDLESVRPKGNIFKISKPKNTGGGGCPGFLITLLVEDLDGDRLRVRFVSDNYVNNFVKLISDHEYAAAFGPREIRETILTELYIKGLAFENTHVISMFVTDAPDFVITSTDTDVLNYGIIESDPDQDGIDDYSVLEYRWTLNFLDDEAGVCP